MAGVVGCGIVIGSGPPWKGAATWDQQHHVAGPRNVALQGAAFQWGPNGGLSAAAGAAVRAQAGATEPGLRHLLQGGGQLLCEAVPVEEGRGPGGF